MYTEKELLKLAGKLAIMWTNFIEQSKNIKWKYKENGNKIKWIQLCNRRKFMGRGSKENRRRRIIKCQK